MKLVMVAVVVTGGGVALIGTGSQSALAASISANNIDISTDDGELTSLTIAPVGSVEWTGIDDEAYHMLSFLVISNDSTDNEETKSLVRTLHQDCSVTDYDFCNTTTGNTSFAEDPYQLTNDSQLQDPDGSVFNLSDFSAPEGETKNTTVYVTHTVRLEDSDRNTIESTTETTSFEVQVTNQASSVSVSLALNTDATD